MGAQSETTAAPETHTSGLGVFLPGPASGIVNVWRRQFDPSYKFLAPHITVAYPPFVPLERWPEVRRVVAASLAPFCPFEVRLHELGIFTGSPQVLWLKPEDGGLLARMRTALEAALPEFVPPLPFTYQPHVSIGFFQELEALQQAYEKVRSELAMTSKKPIHFQVNQLCYGFQILNQPWQVYDRIRLKGEPDHAEAH